MAVLVSVWSGGLTAEGVQVRALLDSASSGVSLRVATTVAGLASGTSFGPVMTGDGFIAALSVTGLIADTAYHYEVVIDGVAQTALRGQFRTMGAASYTVAFGNCHETTSNHAAFAAILAASPLFWVHTGDWGYRDYAGSDMALRRQYIWEHLTRSNIRDLCLRTPIWRMYDDHDFGPDGSSGYDTSGVKTAYRDASVLAYRQSVPSYPLQGDDTHPNYQSMVQGRIRWLLLDCRADRQYGTTMLGAAQKAWLLGQITDAAAAGQVVGLLQSVTVVGTHADGWGAAGTINDTNEIRDHIAAVGAKGFMVAGDMHSSAWTVSNARFPGWPVFHAAPLDRANSHKGGPYDSGFYPASTTANLRGLWGRLQITDDLTADTLTVQFATMEGASPVSGFGYTATFDVDPVFTAVEIYDGSAWSNVGFEKFSGGVWTSEDADTLVQTATTPPPGSEQWTTLATVGGAVGSYDLSALPTGTYRVRVVAVNASGESISNEVQYVDTGAVASDVSFAGVVPMQSLSASVSRTVPIHAASFAGTVPFQSLAAGLTSSAPVFAASFAGVVPLQTLSATAAVAAPVAGLSFSATVPFQTLAASVTRTIPVFAASFAGTVPIQSLAATATVSPPVAVGFAGAVPMQSLTASVGIAAPVAGIVFGATIPKQTLAVTISAQQIQYAASFAGTVPLASLAASVSRTVPAFSAAFAATVTFQTLGASVGISAPTYAATFAGTVPMQSLSASVAVAMPGAAISYAGAIPMQGLSASVSRTIPPRLVSYAGAVPMQSLSSTITRTVPGFAASFAATVPFQALTGTLTAAPPGSSVSFSAAVPAQTLTASIEAEQIYYTASFAGVVPMQTLAFAVVLGELVPLQILEMETTMARRLEASTTLARRVEMQTTLQRASQLTTTI